MNKNSDQNVSVGEKLIMLRKQKNMSRTQVAKEVGISEFSLKAYELNFRFPRPEVKQRLARFYGVTVGSLFFNEG